MKTNFKYLLPIIASIIAFPAVSQTNIDFMGFPSNTTFNNSTSIVHNRSAKSITEVQILKSFASPTSLPSGIASDGENLWVCGYNEYNLYKISSVDGSLLQTIPISIQRPYGISYKNGIIYLLDNYSKNIFAYDAISGACIDTIIPNDTNIIYPTGLLFFENQFVFNDTKGPQPSATGDSTLFFDDNNNFVKGDASYGDFSSGIAFDGKYLWINDNPSQTSNRIDPESWQVVESIKTPGGMYPNGICFDGSNMWVINNESDSIYMFTPSNITNIVSNNFQKLSTVYPNPAQGQFNIHLNNFIATSITISDNAGRIVANKTIFNKEQNIQLNTTELGLPNGIYIIAINGNNGSEMNKLVVR